MWSSTISWLKAQVLKSERPGLKCSCGKDEQIESWRFFSRITVDLGGRDTFWEMLRKKEWDPKCMLKNNRSRRQEEQLYFLLERVSKNRENQLKVDQMQNVFSGSEFLNREICMSSWTWYQAKETEHYNF